MIRDTLSQTRVQTQTSVERLKKERNALERSILGHYERLNEAVTKSATESAYADLQEKIQEQEQRKSEVMQEMEDLSSLMIDESDVREALSEFDAVWKALPPLDRSRVIHQIVDSIQYDGHTKELSITYHPLGIKTFSQEQKLQGGAAVC